MRYAIETTENGCKEILEVDGHTFERNHERISGGSRCTDNEFHEQMEEQQYCEEILDKVYDVFSSFLPLDLMQLSEMFEE